MSNAQTHAAIAAHRFGLAEPRLDGIGSDARGWLLAQIGPADSPIGVALASGSDALKLHDAFRLAIAARANPPAMNAMSGDMAAAAPAMAGGTVEQRFADHYRPVVDADLRSRLGTAATTSKPFAERLVWFWSNHFTVSNAKAATRAMPGAFEREAIRPHIAGRFEDMLRAAVTHPAMLRYLDNEQSAGPNSRLVQRLNAQATQRGTEQRPRLSGLNENLAREVLELHTLGAIAAREGVYTQADVTEFARLLTGWRMPPQQQTTAQAGRRFDPAWHEPGAKHVVGRSYAEGPAALDTVLRDLALHPATARFIATKLARHFVADEPPVALIARLSARYRDSGGDLAAVYRELIAAPESWSAAPTKFKTPEEFVVSSARLLEIGEAAFMRAPDAGIAALGQRVHGAPSPAGWPDRSDEWLGPDAVWKRIEWSTRLANQFGLRIDARELASNSLGPLLGGDTRTQIARAADGPQALVLLLLAPEFQRR